MTGPGANTPGDRNKKADLGGADAVPDTPSTAKRQGAEPSGTERRLTPRAATATPTGTSMKPVIWIIVAIVVIAGAYLLLGR
jgi:hypothetical protein